VVLPITQKGPPPRNGTGDAAQQHHTARFTRSRHLCCNCTLPWTRQLLPSPSQPRTSGDVPWSLRHLPVWSVTTQLCQSGEKGSLLLASPCARWLTPSSSWSAICLASPVSFTSHRSCLSAASLAPSAHWGADQGPGYRYELCRPGRRNPAPPQALLPGVIRSSLAAPGGRRGSSGASCILHHTHDGGNFLPRPLVLPMFPLSPVGCPWVFLLLSECMLLDAGDLSRPLHGRVPPPRFSSHLDVLLRGGKPRGRAVPARPKPNPKPKSPLHYLNHNCSASHGLPSGIPSHPVCPR
jgi:hypothetical protein